MWLKIQSSLLMKKKKKKNKKKNKKAIFLKKLILKKFVFCRKVSIEHIFIVALFFAGLIVFLLLISYHQFLYQKVAGIFGLNDEKAAVEQVVDVEKKIEDPEIDTTNWKLYQTRWYGFEIKYPENWKKPLLKTATAKDRWEYRYQFRKQNSEEGGLYAGFDVVVYNLKKTKELFNSDEFPTIKSEELENQDSCKQIEGHIIENEKYSAEQIYVGPDDDCHNPVYFFTLTSEDYIFNIAPIGEDEEMIIQTRNDMLQNFPEFFVAASTFNIIEIKRPQAIIRQKINAPMPVWYKKDSLGRMVCAKKNDKPEKSDKNKKKHLDMECCLDPNEYLNPHCYYEPAKYGKFL